MGKDGRIKMYGGMRFRNLEMFNRVMLVKQDWKLIQEPHSLVARIFKERDFKNSKV